MALEIARREIKSNLGTPIIVLIDLREIFATI